MGLLLSMCTPNYLPMIEHLIGLERLFKLNFCGYFMTLFFVEYLLDFPRMEKKGLAGKINLHQPHETPMMNLGCDMNKAQNI